MTDREMLQAAARAAGLKLADEVDSYLPGSRALWIVGPGGRDVVWQPLSDDGDAFRLASKLELDVLHRVVGGSRVEVLPAGGSLIQEFYGHPADRLAATRRAIVKAAAKARRVAPAHPGERKEEGSTA